PSHVSRQKDSPPFRPATHLTRPLTLPRNLRPARANRSTFHCKIRADSFSPGTAFVQRIQSSTQSLSLSDRKASIRSSPSSESQYRSTLPLKRLRTIAACEENSGRHQTSIFLEQCPQSTNQSRASRALRPIICMNRQQRETVCTS